VARRNEGEVVLWCEVVGQIEARLRVAFDMVGGFWQWGFKVYAEFCAWQVLFVD